MSTRTIVTEKPVVLDGYQALLKPSKFGYSLATIFTDDLIKRLEVDRVEALKWCEPRLKNPKRATLKPTPWEEVSENEYKVKFNWQENRCPTIVDSEGTVVSNKELPIYSGSTVKLAFFQKPYILNDGLTYGTSLKLEGVQIISLSNGAGVDTGDMSDEEISALFGTTKGFKENSPNITATPAVEVDDDF